MIVTFYSYKGGVGRSMALVNVGEILADAGYDVILCDFDLEAPSLDRYVTDEQGSTAAMQASLGIVDLLEEYKEVLAQPGHAGPPEGKGKAKTSVPPGHADVNGLILRRPSSCATFVPSANVKRLGRLSLLGAGRRDGQWAARYSERVQHFDWSDFYARWAGAAYFDFFRNDLIAGRTVVLVDSRTGVTEHGGICTHHLADLVILLSAPNDVNIEGTRWMAKILADADVNGLRQGRPLQAIPVAARVETAAEVQELADFRYRFEAEFAAAVPAAAGGGREFIQDSEIPYIPFFAFTERVVARQNNTPHRELYRAYEALAQAIVGVGLEGDLLSAPRRQDWLGTRHVGQARQALSSTLERHRLWLETGGKAGAQAVLRGFDLSRQQLIGADLDDADLTEANLEVSDLTEAKLRRARLGTAVMRGTILRSAALAGADLRGADLTGAVLTRATLDNCRLDDARLEGATLAGAQLRFTTLTRATLTRANLSDCDLRNVDLTDAVLLGADLRGADLREAAGLDARELAQAITDETTRLDPAAGSGRRPASRPPDQGVAALEILPVAAQREFPGFADDFRFLEKELLPRFRSFSGDADRLATVQRIYQGVSLALLGIAVVAGLVVVYAILQGSTDSLSVNAVPIAAAALGSAAVTVSRARSRDGADVLRRQAERLRREYFLYLGRIGGYADNGSRNDVLRNEVTEILRSGTGP